MILQIETFAVSDFEQNCRILYNPEKRTAVVFDPGGDAQKIESRLKSLNLALEGIYLTHSHIDHCGAVLPLMESYPVPLYGHSHPGEQSFRSHITEISQMYGLPTGKYFNCPEPNVFLTDNQTINILGAETRVLETPGHSPGSVCFWIPSENMVFSGDVLFLDSVGRTDLPGGDPEMLLASIDKLMRLLPPQTKVLPGHGPDTTLGRERKSNPFLR